MMRSAHRHVHQQHGGKPAQTAGFDEVPLGRADGIAINATGPDLGPPAPFDGVIESDHDWGGVRQEGCDQQQEKPAGCGARRPRGAVEDTVEGAEFGIAVTTQDA
jgi:hypothetical protein